MKRFIITIALLLPLQAWADAPVEDKSVAAERVEAAQIQADIAWRRLNAAKYDAAQAEQDVAEAERADRQARQRAQEAAARLTQARDRLAAAQAKQRQAEADLTEANRQLDQLWRGGAKPR
jgi:chromosome segregation ATPase